MDFVDAKNVLLKRYVELDFELISEEPERLFFRMHGEAIAITREEIVAFASNQDTLSDAAAAPVECSVSTPSFREQLLRPLDPRGTSTLLSRDDKAWFFRSTSAEQPSVRIGPASDVFLDFFRFDEAYLASGRFRVSRNVQRVRIRPVAEEQTLRDFLYRPLTIQVSNLTEPSVAAAVARSSAIIDGCLFTLSYLREFSYRLDEQWPATRRRFPLEDRDGTTTEFQLPLLRYNEDVIRFYQLGTGTDIPELQFLAFYQVLEYFFLTVSDEALYSKLKMRIGDPTFRLQSTHLDRVIQDVADHKALADETEMLRAVLEKYVGDRELTTFIERYETHLGEKYYTKRRERFGVECEVRFQPGHLFGNVAKVVKTVRNALVHSSDRFERVGRHVPFTKSSEFVEREVPLVKFLAERVITATAVPAV